MDPIKEEDIKSREIEIQLKKKDRGITKLLIFDLDETLAHCVR